MILEYNKFINILNKTLINGSYADLLCKIANSPDRYLGVLRPTKPKTKLIQNITQSHEIKFGDALENIFEHYFSTLGFEMLPKRLSSRETKDSKDYYIDQLFKKDNIIYLIEQKVRDDHDSTKKVGQFNNFEAKYFEVSNKYEKNTVIPIMWFIDDALKKNKNYYLNQMLKMANFYKCEPRLYYGIEMFSNSTNGIKDFPNKMWNEIIQYLIEWKKTLPDMPDINFDNNCNKVFEEIKSLPLSIYLKIFNNNEIKQQILPILFPQGEVLKKLKHYFLEKNNIQYKELVSQIDEYLAQLSQN